MTKGMLGRVSKMLIPILALIMGSCSSRDTRLKEVSMNAVGHTEYSRVYDLASDSIKTWASNNLGYYQYLGKSKKWVLDSLLCFNKRADRFVTCILKQQLLKEGIADDIDFFYGEKINNSWYFFQGANIFIPRSSYGNGSSTPLNFNKLHEIALREVYSGYLTKSGEINEEWFTNHFENVGWCSTCKTKEEFQQSRLEGVAALWATRDTTQPIKYLKDTSGVLP